MTKRQRPNANPASTGEPLSTFENNMIRHLGLVEYQSTWQAMRTFTDTREALAPDEIWLLEHPPVFTLGRAGRPEHILDPGEIPVVHTDRGGQVTYHGPGQLVAYVLLDLERRRMGIRRLVQDLEQSVIALAAEAGIHATCKKGAPGVYVAGKKLAALGLRVRRGCCYHGLSLNVKMDLRPFDRIDPCGYPGLQVAQLHDLGVPWEMEEVKRRLSRHLLSRIYF
ncbi:MAG: lipoyl(octanoyl) transferase [Candidatus Kentron sp. G]|nr:MAG: lipoyl(octanoyl) transferase [Candidatus Kentron sp. G]VFN02256.1 MAG: lipoyl(octanoyl) transferase [Candidatus Kentron sp. G]VFN02788.1 MAG: lipoyl(octanoyl) transferase [Candidatus Kentron sp. G]